MGHLAYIVRYCVVQINTSLFTVTFYPSVRTTLLYNFTK